MLREPNWAIIADLALKAVDDAKEAMARTVLLAEDPMDAVLISMVAIAVLRGEHDGIKDGMADSPVIAAAASMAEDVAEAIRGRKREELKRLMPKIRELLKHKRAGVAER